MVGVRLQLVRGAGPVSTAMATAPGGARGVEIVRAVADERDSPGATPSFSGEAQHHAGLGLAAMAAVIAGDEIEMRHRPSASACARAEASASLVAMPSR